MKNGLIRPNRVALLLNRCGALRLLSPDLPTILMIWRECGTGGAATVEAHSAGKGLK
jgi:hypothetical protein